MSKERLLSALRELESIESEKKSWYAKIKKMREEFNKLKDRFLNPKIKEIRRNLYEIENKKNVSKLKIKEIEKTFMN